MMASFFAFVLPPSELLPFPSPLHVPPASKVTPGLDDLKEPHPSPSSCCFSQQPKGRLKNINRTPQVPSHNAPMASCCGPQAPGLWPHASPTLSPLPLHSSPLWGLLCFLKTRSSILSETSSPSQHPSLSVHPLSLRLHSTYHHLHSQPLLVYFFHHLPLQEKTSINLSLLFTAIYHHLELQLATSKLSVPSPNARAVTSLCVLSTWQPTAMPVPIFLPPLGCTSYPTGRAGPPAHSIRGEGQRAAHAGKRGEKVTSNKP